MESGTSETRSESVVSRQRSLKSRLAKSHLTVVLFAVPIFILGISATLQLEDGIRGIASVNSPSTLAALHLKVALSDSLAVVHEFLNTKDARYREQWEILWNDKILTEVALLERLQVNWLYFVDSDGFRNMLEDVKLLQWAVLASVQSPGNEPAWYWFNRSGVPVVEEIIQNITTLIDREKLKRNDELSARRLARMADFRAHILIAKDALAAYLHRGEAGDAMRARNSVERAQEELLRLEHLMASFPPAQQTVLQGIKRRLQIYSPLIPQIIAVRKSEQWNIAKYLMEKRVLPSSERIGNYLDSLIESQETVMIQEFNEAKAIILNVWLVGGVLLVIMSVIALVYSRLLAGRIANPISRLSRMAAQLAKGIDVPDMPTASEEEVSQLIQSFNRMRHEIKEKEANLRSNENEVRQIIEASPYGIVMVSREGRILLVNRMMESMFGYTREELVGKSIEHLVPERFRSQHAQNREAYGLSPHTRFMGEGRELWALRKDRTEFPVDIGLSFVPSPSGITIIAAIVDISQRKKDEETLKAEHAFNEQILGSLNSLLISLDPFERVTHWNTMAEKLLGVRSSGAIGRSLMDLGVGWDKAALAHAIEECKRTNKPVRIDNLVCSQEDGEKKLLGITVNPMLSSDGDFIGLLLLGADITEKKTLERQLAQALKLEAIGQLAAGIAHEINTPMQFVSDNLRFLQESCVAIEGVLTATQTLVQAVQAGTQEADAVKVVEKALKAADVDYLLREIPKALRQSLDGAERVRNIVRAMKEFSHPGTEEKTLIDLNHAIECTVTVARNEWKYVADLDLVLAPDLPMVPCRPGELNQVVLNILVNAAHAIGEKLGPGNDEKGKITVRTQAIDGWVEIRITDTGPGIPESVQGKIFDPFFTTKEVGKGTGQGLAIAHDVIVKKHGGELKFETEIGQGTTFIIRLPLLSADERASSALSYRDEPIVAHDIRGPHSPLLFGQGSLDCS